MKNKIIQITREDLKKLKPEQKEAVLTKLIQSHSTRQNTMNKWLAILIGLIFTAIISCITLILQGYLILATIFFLIVLMISIYFLSKYRKAFEERGKFWKWTNIIEENIREELKGELKKELTYPGELPIEY